MNVSPISDQRGYVHDNATERRVNGTFIPVAPEKLTLNDWMRIPSLLIALAGLVGNGAVLWLLGFRIQRNHLSVYILNLAAADALFLCCSLLNCINRLAHYLFSSVTYCVIIYLRYASYAVGLSLLAAISTERCLSALFPLWYRNRRRKHTSAAVCAVLWALAGLLWVTRFVLCFYLYPDKFCSGIYRVIESVWFTLLSPVLCVSSLTLLLRVQCSSRRRRPPRLYLLVLLTVLVFLLCGLPMGIWSVLYFHFHVDLMPSWLRQLLACVNSSVNPLIYFFLGRRGQKRREPLRVVLRRALEDEREIRDETRDKSNTNSPETSI
ncbi:mas-related G-protein coupled receptor member X4-like [Sarcophilus harrisii]|uniref:mas-related G-protein coupled receptor member X4-like n=1 Tax=Sarcophilus harrisii TaxID=9305 RepID=UPI000273C3F3|nr:mas-related G-protein coupled receptor member X4-like [Sarcophilus harrisii]